MIIQEFCEFTGIPFELFAKFFKVNLRELFTSQFLSSNEFQRKFSNQLKKLKKFLASEPVETNFLHWIRYLHFKQKMPPEEIADKIGVPVTLVKIWLGKKEDLSEQELKAIIYYFRR